MAKIESLKEVIKINSNFRNAINLYLNLNQKEKILSYIPTRSSMNILKEYLLSVQENKEQATLLIGPYGKGKSHLLLILLAILSMERNGNNTKVIYDLEQKIQKVDGNVNKIVSQIWNNQERFLPVIISNTQNDLNQAFLYALNEALKINSLEELIPDTYYTIAIRRINEWKEDYPDTFKEFEKYLESYGMSVKTLVANLKQYYQESLDIFKEIYPLVTAGSIFNPLASSDVLPLYKSVSDKLKENYHYSGIYIVFDEFSKFIEGQNEKAIGNNMKLLQDICELASDSNNSQIHITMVAHKSIKEYGKYLSKDLINSFTGIEGRVKEKYFITSSKNNYELISNAIIKDEAQLKNIPQYDRCLGNDIRNQYYSLPFFKANFNKNDFEEIILKGCYPLNPIGAYLLLNISEKVAQNERTLFTFISKDEQYSMARFVSEHNSNMRWCIGADLIYDYFGNIFKKDVNNEFVHNQWLNAEYALSKCDVEDERKVLKALAVILIVNKNDELPANNNILSKSTGIDDGAQIIDNLLQKQLIYKKRSTDCYVFKTRAGSELKKEIKKQRSIKGDRVNISKVLLNVSGQYYIIPKRYNSENMMTRYFRHEFMTIQDFLSISNSNVLFEDQDFSDGKVISIYSDQEIIMEAIETHVEKLACSKLIILVSGKNFLLKKQAKDYEIIQELKENNIFINNNEVLKRELPLMEEDIEKELGKCLKEMYYENPSSKILFWNDSCVNKFETKFLEQIVNISCEKVYYKTPVINNEMINRREIKTSQTKKARKKIIEAILLKNINEDFYKGTNQEATIYRALFINTKLKQYNYKSNLNDVINEINLFIDNCSNSRKNVKLLIDHLEDSPYGMRRGVIPVYLADVLMSRNEDIIIYFNNKEIQLSADIIINMCEYSEDYSIFISEEDLQKEKYLNALNELFDIKGNLNLTDSRINNILICMQRWLRSLPQISRNLANAGSYYDNDTVSKLFKLKKILQRADINPYEILFVELPNVIGVKSDYEKTYRVIQECKNKIDNFYNLVVKKIVKKTFDVFESKTYEDMYHLLKEWYARQSEISKNGLYEAQITNFMSCIEKLNVYDDIEITKRIIKVITGVYIENWDVNAEEYYLNELQKVKKQIEEIKEQNEEKKLKLSFIGKNGDKIEKYYEHINENTGIILKNILEDTLEEFDDLSVNEKVSVLLEMIEEVMG